MNKLTKVSLSALCGSLAAIASAANAGTMEVLGGATATWSSNSEKDTGNPIGMNFWELRLKVQVSLIMDQHLR